MSSNQNAMKLPTQQLTATNLICVFTPRYSKVQQSCGTYHYLFVSQRSQIEIEDET